MHHAAHYILLRVLQVRDRARQLGDLPGHVAAFILVTVVTMQRMDLLALIDQMPIAQATVVAHTNGTSGADLPGRVDRAPELSSEFVPNL